jgi:lysozyme family protein
VATTITPSLATARPTLELETDNDPAAVKDLQQQLHDAGFYNGLINGTFGPDTQQAVKDLQGAAAKALGQDASGNTIDVDGIAGQQTWTLLAELSAHVIDIKSSSPTPTTTPSRSKPPFDTHEPPTADPILASNRAAADAPLDPAYAGATKEMLSHLFDAKGNLTATMNRILNIAKQVDVPPELFAGIWYREASFDPSKVLQNGDPIGQVTTHVPKGLLFHSFEESAVAAFNDFAPLKARLDLHFSSTDKGAIATFAEHYNGLGYRTHGLSSPYVFAGTTKYTGGLFTGDGQLDPKVKDQRVGVLVVADALQNNPTIAKLKASNATAAG